MGREEEELTPIDDLSDDMKGSMLDGVDDEESDTDTDTDESVAGVESDTDTGTDDDSEDNSDDDSEDNPDTPILEKAGLAGKFKSVEAALGSVRSQEDYIQAQQLTQANEMADLKAAVGELGRRRGGDAPAVSPEDVADMFATDPRKALRDLGYVHNSELGGLIQGVKNNNQRLSRQELVQTLGDFDELKPVAQYYRKTGKVPAEGEHPVFDKMLKLYDASGSEAAFVDLVPLLYEAAKGGNSKPPVTTLSETEKRRARTSGTRGRKANSSRPNFEGMGERELEKWIDEQLRGSSD